MAYAGFFELPFDIRVQIFDHLFRNSTAEIGFNYVVLPLERSMFYVCKQLSIEARSIAKGCLKLRFRDGSSLESIPQATRSLYFPNIRQVEVSSTNPTHGLIDLSLFSSLRRLDISNYPSPYAFPPYPSFRFASGPNEASVHAILAGVLDEKLKRCDAVEYDTQSNWFPRALHDPKRSFQVVVSALLSWEEPRESLHDKGVKGFLTVKYDLDTMTTVERKARTTPVGSGYHVTWRNGCLEEWQEVRKGMSRTWKLISTASYKLDESLHRDLLKAELVRARV